MDTYIRFTATASLLIGLQLLSLGKVSVAAQPNQSSHLPNSAAMAMESAIAFRQHLVPAAKASQDPEPRPKPPTTTRGGGTR